MPSNSVLNVERSTHSVETHSLVGSFDEIVTSSVLSNVCPNSTFVSVYHRKMCVNVDSHLENSAKNNGGEISLIVMRI